MSEIYIDPLEERVDDRDAVSVDDPNTPSSGITVDRTSADAFRVQELPSRDAPVAPGDIVVSPDMLVSTDQDIAAPVAAVAGQVTAEGYDATTRQVAPEETSAYQLSNILNKDSPLMQRARQEGYLTAAERGLQISSIAAGHAMGAMADRATPLAQQDALVYAKQAQLNQEAQNRAAEFGAGARNIASITQAQLSTDTSRVNMEAASRRNIQAAANQLQAQITNATTNVSVATTNLNANIQEFVATLDSRTRQEISFWANETTREIANQQVVSNETLQDISDIAAGERTAAQLASAQQIHDDAVASNEAIQLSLNVLSKAIADNINATNLEIAEERNETEKDIATEIDETRRKISDDSLALEDRLTTAQQVIDKYAINEDVAVKMAQQTLDEYGIDEDNKVRREQIGVQVAGNLLVASQQILDLYGIDVRTEDENTRLDILVAQQTLDRHEMDQNDTTRNRIADELNTTQIEMQRMSDETQMTISDARIIANENLAQMDVDMRQEIALMEAANAQVLAKYEGARSVIQAAVIANGDIIASEEDPRVARKKIAMVNVYVQKQLDFLSAYQVDYATTMTAEEILERYNVDPSEDIAEYIPPVEYPGTIGATNENP